MQAIRDQNQGTQSQAHNKGKTVNKTTKAKKKKKRKNSKKYMIDIYHDDEETAAAPAAVTDVKVEEEALKCELLMSDSANSLKSCLEHERPG